MIAISSIVGKRGYPYLSTYAASKHGVIGLVKSVAQEIAKTKITINAICPGYLDTDMTKKSMLDLYKEGIIAHIQIHDELDLSVEAKEQANKIEIEIIKLDIHENPNQVIG